MDFNGLSTDQAPPIWVPLRFFLTAPFFGMLAGVLIFFSDIFVLKSRYSMDSVVITHVMTIGFLSFVMLGAITQMLPVLAGVKIPKVDLVAKVSYAMLLIGAVFMFLGLSKDNPTFTTVSFIGLGGGFLTILSAIAISLKEVGHFTATVRGIATSVFFAFAIVFMGLYLLYGFITQDITQVHMIVTNIHSVWAIFGFGVILIIGAAFQILPMFYVAPRFKQFCKKRVVWLISTGLVLWLLLNVFYDKYALLAKAWIALFIWAFATTVWIKLNKRKRPVSDITVWYWRAASVFLTLGSFTWIFGEYFRDEYIVMVAILIGGGFILSIMVGMLYKIVPFLVWFHLNAQGYMSIPTMNEMINKNLARLQFVLQIGALVGFIFSFYMPELLKLSALSFIASMMILEYNIIAPAVVYIKTKKTKPDFDMSMFATS